MTTDYSLYKTATLSFRDRYMALPADMPNATAFWGAAGDCWAASTGTQICNGNGNGSIAYVNTTDTSNVEWEPWHFWKQLANAGLISGSYSGFSVNTLCVSANYCMQAGVNVPSGPFNSGWMVLSTATSTVGRIWAGRGTNQDRNILALGNPRNATNFWYGASLSAQQQWQIDTKIDDGKPYTGMLVDMSGTNAAYTTSCATEDSDEFDDTPPGTTSNDAEYNVTLDTVSTSQGCIPFFDLE